MPDQVSKQFTHPVPASAEPERIDRYLAAQSDLGLSRTKVRQLIDDGAVLVNGKVVPARYQVRPGDEIAITLVAAPPSPLSPENLQLEIVYQDQHLAVINKPAGMVTHPAPGSRSGTLVNALLHHLGSLSSGGGGTDRPGIVHRLDKDTTGLLLVAKDDQTHRALQAAIAARQVRRSYLALIWGHVVEDEGVIDAPMGRSPNDRKKMAIVTDGREAVTRFRLQDRFRSYDLLDVELQTGRTHQIRVHFAHIGHPVFGDSEYGGRERSVRGLFAPERPLAKQLLALLHRQALHSQSIRFSHPATGESMSFSVPPPGDFRSVLDILIQRGH